MSNTRKQRTQKSRTASLALAPCSAGIAKQQQRVQHAAACRIVERASRLLVAHMDELNAENSQLIYLINRAHKMLAEGRTGAARLLLFAAIKG